MQSCRSFGEPCRYCGSEEIIIKPSQYAGKCATCSWEAFEGRTFIERMVAAARRSAAQRTEGASGKSVPRAKVTPVVKGGNFAFPSLFGEKRRINLPKPLAPLPPVAGAKQAAPEKPLPMIETLPTRQPFNPRIISSRG